MAAVLHGFKLNGIEYAVRSGVLIVIQHQVGDTFCLLCIRLGEIPQELAECI